MKGTERSDVSLRMEVFAKSYCRSVRQFEEDCGLSNGFVRSIVKGIGADKLKCITDKFPNLSVEWLMNGTGEMLIQTSEEKKSAADRRFADRVVQMMMQKVENLMGRMAQKVDDYEKEIARLRELLKGKDEIISDRDSTIFERDRIISEKDRIISEKDMMLMKLLRKG